MLFYLMEENLQLIMNMKFDTNCNKCKQIVDDIKSNPDIWSIIFEDNERNGVMILHNKILL